MGKEKRVGGGGMRDGGHWQHAWAEALERHHVGMPYCINAHLTLKNRLWGDSDSKKQATLQNSETPGFISCPMLKNGKNRKHFQIGYWIAPRSLVPQEDSKSPPNVSQCRREWFRSGCLCKLNFIRRDAWPFLYLLLWLLWCYQGRAEWLWRKLHGLSSPRYLLSGLLLKKNCRSLF